jgi:hypothetical protein
MSSLIFYTDADNVVVATDTLVTTPDLVPLKFSSKAIYLPHLRTIIAAVGAGEFFGDWVNFVNQEFMVPGVKHLNTHSPRVLADRWEKFCQQAHVPALMRCTIYHLGFGEDDDAPVGFLYRSTSGFVSESVQRGMFARPPTSSCSGNTVFEVIEQMVRQQRREQDALIEDRVVIGGEVHALHLTREGLNVKRLFAFDDYQEHERAILERHASGQ